jgi:hypothetical protein
MRVGTLILFLLSSALCLGAELSGVWGTHSRSAWPSAAVPVAVRIEQAGDHLSVLTIMASARGRSLEHRNYVIHRDVDINVIGERVEVDFLAPAATWIIDSSGALMIRRCGAGSIVFFRSTDLIQ